MDQNVVSLGECSMWASEKKKAYCAWIKWSIDVHYIQSIDNVVEFIYILSDFLLSGSIHFWERDCKVSNYGSGFIYFSLKFHQVLPHGTWCSLVRHIKTMYFWRINPFIILYCPSFSLMTFLNWQLFCPKLIWLLLLSLDEC